MHQELIKISKLKGNSGQIPGLPKNPRKITSGAKDALRKSLVDSPEILEFKQLLVYPFEGNYVVIAGNQRLSLCRDMKYKELPCFVLPADTTIEKLKEYSIKDNHNYGQWNDLSEWDNLKLLEWGINLELELSETKNVSFNVSNTTVFEIIVSCKDADQRDKLIDELTNKGIECRKKGSKKQIN